MGKPCSVLSVLGLTVLLAFALITESTLRVNAQPIQKTPDWSTPDDVYDLAVCADGSLVAVATGGCLKVYDASGSLLWNWGGGVISVSAVDVSDDGNVVVATAFNSTSGEYRLFFWKNAKTLSGTPQPDWSSGNLFGWIRPEALAVSSDGNQVVVVGTGPNVFYWSNALTLTGGGKAQTWDDALGGFLEHVDISDDGDIVAILGWNWSSGEPFAFIYKGSKTRTGPQSEGYSLTYTFGTGNGLDMALSDSGSHMVVGAYIAAGFWEGRVYYFNTSMSANWAPQWIWRLALNEHAWAVDISDNGDTVAVATNWWETQPNYKPYVLGIVHGASAMRGIFTGLFDKKFTNAEDYTDHQYHDVSIDGLGLLAVGGTGDHVFAVNATTGELLWYYNGAYPLVSKFVRVSEGGSTVVTAGEEVDSLYYFKLAAAPPPVGGIVISPKGNLAAAANNTAITFLAVILIIAATAAAINAHKRITFRGSLFNSFRKLLVNAAS